MLLYVCIYAIELPNIKVDIIKCHFTHPLSLCRNNCHKIYADGYPLPV